MVATQPLGFDAEAAPPSVEAVREATRAVLPLVDLETVKEREVVAMVEQRLGAMVADTEPLRVAVQDEIDRCLLQDDELLIASGVSAPSAGGAAGVAAAPAGAGSGGGPRKKAEPKRKRAGGLDGFVVDDDADDEDYREEEEEEEEEEGGARDRPGAKKKTVTAAAARRYTKSEWNAARHDWSAPAPTVVPNANDANANTSAPPIATIADEKVLSALALLPGDKPKTAKSLASYLKAPKSDVNKALYRLEREGKATKRAGDGGAPEWTPAGARSDGGPSARSGPAPHAKSRSGAEDETAKTETENGRPAAPPRAAAPFAAVAGEICALSESKRVAVGEYRGRKHVSLREFYCKNGAWLPGKKGINLSVEQWRGLRDAASAVTARARSGETSDCVVAELGGGRRVTCGVFRGAMTVGVREYYEKNGEMLPGFRGLNMSAQQWDALAARLEAIDAALDRNA